MKGHKITSTLEAELVRDRVIDAATEFVVSRGIWSKAKAARNAFRCTEFDKGDYASGDPGQPVCRYDEVQPDGMCDECQKWMAANVEVVRVRTRALLALPKLQRAVRALIKSEGVQTSREGEESK